jgi:hypothetical protein
MTDDEPLYPHTPGPGCLHCEILGIDFGEDDPGSDPGSSYPPPRRGHDHPSTSQRHRPMGQPPSAHKRAIGAGHPTRQTE